MTAKKKVVLAVVVIAALDLLVLSLALRPRQPASLRTPEETMRQVADPLEEQYQEMVNAYPVASEESPGHPAAQQWQERKSALLAAGYIEARELRLRHSLAASGAVRGFFAEFQARFPGVECTVRNPGTEMPIAVVIARTNDLGPAGAIERFLIEYAPPE